ncbi:MAG: hypothetical protein J0I14_17180 [Propionibacteriaceae bacterium]|nr:hypothetical protein [Propionibacteriaceae bacterium]
MHFRWRRATAVVGLALSGLLLAGCDATGTVTVQTDDTILVDLVVNANDVGIEVSEDGTLACPGQIDALAVEPQTTPNGTLACRITGTIRPSELGQTASLTTVGDYRVLQVQRQSAETSPGGRTDLTIRFPGDVLQASAGQVEGNNVRITNIADFTGLTVIALNRPGPADRVIWAAAGVFGTLLVVGTLWLVRHRRQQTPPPAPPEETSLDWLAPRAGDPTNAAPEVSEPIVPEPPLAPTTTDPADHDHSIWAPPGDGEDAGPGR